MLDIRREPGLVREVLSSFRFLNSTYPRYPRSEALPWNALPSRLRLALAMLFDSGGTSLRCIASPGETRGRVLKTGRNFWFLAQAPLVITHNFARNSPIPLVFSYSYSARRAVLVLVLDQAVNRVRVRVPFH
jgi:hypothetical protein